MKKTWICLRAAPVALCAAGIAQAQEPPLDKERCASIAEKSSWLADEAMNTLKTEMDSPSVNSTRKMELIDIHGQWAGVLAMAHRLKRKLNGDNPFSDTVDEWKHIRDYQNRPQQEVLPLLQKCLALYT